MTEPDPALIVAAHLDTPVDPTKALLPESIDDLLQPDYLDVEIGWCILPNGAGYLALNHKMPGVTVDMIDWWYGWHGIEDLRYMLWYPPSHYGARVSPEDLAKVLDPTVPATQKYQGVTHFVVEDVGDGGASDIHISFMTPKDLGFDMERFHAPNVGTVVGGQIKMKSPADPPDAPPKGLIMLHFIREVPDGIEYRSRFWMGHGFVDGKPQCLLPSGAAVPGRIPKGGLTHNIEEYARLRVLLPKLYAEFGGT